ncbi:MAG: hypothetical protein JNK82_18210 [Myxococcaceae bacterium]|nr:hypothetical protein [Myxococcaceae bacterium]
MKQQPNALALLILGGVTVAFAVLIGAIGLFLHYGEPVQVDVACDRPSGSCTWALASGKQKQFPVSALGSARLEVKGGDTRIVADGVDLSSGTSDPDVMKAHAEALSKLQAFAAGDQPSVSVRYPVGGGKPKPAYWLSVLGAIGFGGGFFAQGLRRLRAERAA